MHIARLCFSIAILIMGVPSVLAQSPETTFKENCSGCHGESGRGDTPIGKALMVPSFKDASIARKSDTDLLRAIKNGSGKMPAFQGKLQDREVTALVRYVHQLQNKK
jgi:mono/diheme cytochrome c family protein